MSMFKPTNLHIHAHFCTIKEMHATKCLFYDVYNEYYELFVCNK